MCIDKSYLYVLAYVYYTLSRLCLYPFSTGIATIVARRRNNRLKLHEDFSNCVAREFKAPASCAFVPRSELLSRVLGGNKCCFAGITAGSNRARVFRAPGNFIVQDYVIAGAGNETRFSSLIFRLILGVEEGRNAAGLA